MSVDVTLVTVYEVVGVDNDECESPSNQFFSKASDAFEKSKPYTRFGQGRPPKAREGIRFPNGTIHLLGDVVITPYDTGAAAEKAECDGTKTKLPRRACEILGIPE